MSKVNRTILYLFLFLINTSLTSLPACANEISDQARSLLEQGKYKQALDLLNTHLQQKPNDADALIELGRWYGQNMEWKSRLSTIRRL